MASKGCLGGRLTAGWCRAHRGIEVAVDNDEEGSADAHNCCEQADAACGGKPRVVLRGPTTSSSD